MNEFNNTCSICLEPLKINDPKCIKKWKCSHMFHKDCIRTWNKDCPLCRTKHLIKCVSQCNNSENPVNTLDINIMKTYRKVPEQHIHIYKNDWKDRKCIRENHDMLIIQPYGVLIICEDCNIIQSYNLKH